MQHPFFLPEVLVQGVVTVTAVEYPTITARKNASDKLKSGVSFTWEKFPKVQPERTCDGGSKSSDPSSTSAFTFAIGGQSFVYHSAIPTVYFGSNALIIFGGTGTITVS